MIDIADLKVGDYVKIVDHTEKFLGEEFKDLLGSICCVTHIDYDTEYPVEVESKCSFEEAEIEYIVGKENEPAEIEALDVSAIDALMFI